MEITPILPLRGRRLLLRPLTEQDAARLFSAVDQSRTSLKRRLEWAGGVSGEQDSLKFIQEAEKEYREGRAHVFGIFEKKGGTIAGVVSLMNIHFGYSKAELGIWIREDLQGRGYAAEAAKILCDYGFHQAHLHRIYARIEPTNRPSRKVLKKVGFHYEGCLRDEKKLNRHWINQECWGLLKSEWKR